MIARKLNIPYIAHTLLLFYISSPRIFFYFSGKSTKFETLYLHVTS